MQTENSSKMGVDSDDDFDWEEVEVPVSNVDENTLATDYDVEEGPSATVKPNIEITLHARPKKDDAEKKRRAALYAERVSRLNCHKVHTVVLLGNARIRNNWLNDPLLHARLMSLTPLTIQNAFSVIHKSRIPEAVRRGRMFESALNQLADWWYKTFTVEPTGHIRNRTYTEVQEVLAARSDLKGKRRAKDEDEGEDEEEVIRSEKSLMKHALMRRGSRDTSAQLFTALCRALGLPARLVVSLQSVPWQAGVGKPKPSAKKKGDKKGKAKATQEDENEDDDMEMEEITVPSSPALSGKEKATELETFPGGGRRLDGSNNPSADEGKGKQKAAPVITLRKSRGQKLGSATKKPVKRERTPDPTETAPVFWTEVFSRADARWLPVDPIRNIVNKRKAFDPDSKFSTLPGTRVENRMVYVVALEEDGYARDVTPRYATEYGAKVSKMRQGGKGKREWWERVMAMVQRPYRLNRDDLEDEELHINQITEQMPTTMSGFKDHPLYVLARHLKRDEVIHPPVELGKFRGEPVYPRSSVVPLKTAENWMRQGRKVREGCQPMKWVKQRAVTVNKQRAVEMAMTDHENQMSASGGDQGEGFSSEKDVMQGLYACSQTEIYKPEPVINGKVPKNDFGNIDLYVPSMLPAGAVYIPYKGASKVARQLGFDYAEAVTGFEFRKRRAIPIISGVVIAAENKDAVLEAYHAAEQEAEHRRRTKRQEQVLKRWQRLVHGLRIRHRLQQQYADRDPPQPARNNLVVEVEDARQAGGFLETADDVVQPYTLPRNLHDEPKSPTAGLSEIYPVKIPHGDSKQTADETLTGVVSFDMDESQASEDLPEEASMHEPSGSVGYGYDPKSNVVPKSMRELAEEAERALEEAVVHHSLDGAEYRPSPPPEAQNEKTTGPVNGHAISTGHTRGSRSKTSTPSTAKTSNRGNTPKVTLKVTTRQGRKRAREDNVSDSDADKSGAISPSKASPVKRSRASKPSTPAVKSDRVLRTRAPKNAGKLQEEREQEEAYKRAVAE